MTKKEKRQQFNLYHACSQALVEILGRPVDVDQRIAGINALRDDLLAEYREHGPLWLHREINKAKGWDFTGKKPYFLEKIDQYRID